MTARVVAAAFVLAALVVGAWWTLRPPTPPSVLFVCSDAHRADFAPGTGDARAMPRLARWAAGAVVHRRAYTTSSWTLPAVASVLTGLDVRRHRTGRVERTGRPDAPFSAHRPELETLPERLAAAGHETVLVHAQPLYRTSGLARDGWDAVFEVHGSGADVNRVAFERIADRSGPLFLLVHYGDVRDYRQRHLARTQAGSASARRADRARIVSAYRAAVRDVDLHAADLIARWEGEFGSDSSLVVFYSDHGEPLAEESPMDEALLHVPLVVRWPRALGVAPGERDEAVSLVDLFPSALDAIGLEAPAGLDGRSLLARGAPSAERALFAGYPRSGPELASMRRGRHKLVLDLAGGGSQLVDTSVAPERRVDDPAAKARLTSLFLEHVAEADREGAPEPAP